MSVGELSDRRSMTTDHVVIRKQGEYDYACGVYCLAAIATDLGSCDAEILSDPLATLLAEPDHACRAATRGLGVRILREMAEFVGLNLENDYWVPNRAFEPNNRARWLLAIMESFKDPLGKIPAYSFPHYVVMYRTTRTHAEIADPHPWNPTHYRISPRELARKAIKTKSGQIKRWRVTRA